MFIGRSPSPLQESLYAAFPSAFGFSGNEKNLEQIEAVAILGIAQTWKEEGDTDPHQVLFFVPSAAEMAWCLETLRGMARRFFQTLKEKPVSSNAKIAAAKTIKELYDHLQIGVRNPFEEEEIHQEPPRWVAYGYKDTDVSTPLWLRQKLLTPEGKGTSV